MKNIIHIFGPSGGGTSTLGKYICKKLEYFFMDTDDYFWLQTEIPYTQKREKSERLLLMKKDIENHQNVVISGSLVDWGDELMSLFTLAIRLETEVAVRLQRIEQREKEHFGNRIEVGGDMYQNHLEFVKWAAAYDNGGLNMRSRAKHDEWQKDLKCPLIELDGAIELEKNFKKIKQYIK